MSLDALEGRTLTLYTKAGCHLCEHAMAALQRLRAEIAFEIQQRDIERDPDLLAAYFDRIPVVSLDGVELCDGVVDEELLREALLARAA
ncbi:MAG: glutaredoxin family protein [Solirubrobacteraceae bacterium]